MYPNRQKKHDADAGRVCARAREHPSGVGAHQAIESTLPGVHVDYTSMPYVGRF